MTIRGKSINLFLMDGIPTGRIKCTLANRTGVAYKIPRTELDKCKGRDDLSQSGVYFLFGVSDQTAEGVVYIGQAGVRKNGEGILYRLYEHRRNSDKDYWNEAVVFTTSNNSFGPTEISYLENRFTNLALKANRYVVKNGNEPSSGGVPTEEKESELEEFLDDAKIIMGVLGYKIFEPLNRIPIIELNEATQTETTPQTTEIVLYLERNNKKSGKLIKATCVRTSEGFVVKAGSMFELDEAVSGLWPSVKNARRIANVNEDGVLQEDVLFKSPSGAAVFVLGKSANGLIEWKLPDGTTLQNLESET